MFLVTAPQLTAEPAGDVLELRPGGSWTAANVTTLEALSDAATAQLDRSKALRLDMAEVRELDTPLRRSTVHSIGSRGI